MVSSSLEEVCPVLTSYHIKAHSHAASNDGGSDRSPTSTPTLEIPIARRLRPPLVSRSTHDGSVRERVKVHTVVEQTRTQPQTPDVGGQYWTPSSTSHSPALPNTSTSDLPCDQNSGLRISAPASPEFEVIDPVRISGESRRNAVNTHGTRVVKLSWIRSPSSGLFFRMHKHSGSEHTSGDHSGTSSRHTSAGGETSVMVPVAPKPPTTISGAKAGTSGTTVILEDALRHSSVSGSVSYASSVNSLRKVAKPSSITAKRLLSAPVSALRRLVSGSGDFRRTMLSAENTKHHQESKKRDKTGQVLEKVSQALARLTEAPARRRTVSSLSAIRSTTQISRVLAESSKSDVRLMAKPQSSIHLERILSGIDMSTISSTSTSSRRFSTMPGPTPEERATYRVKRSATAETETFVKTDISVRGNTSYLPSEARRIHTPPLPNDRRSKRGHFFDYNLPRHQGHDHHIHELPRGPQHRSTGAAPIKSSSHLAPADGPRPSGRSRSNTARSDNSRSGASTAWYDVQLADIDASDLVVTPSRQDSNKSALSARSNMSRCKSGCTISVAELEYQQYEARVDYDIPEHLPNSPLCPRNPRYWRVVRKKGSQFRGC